LIIDQFQFVEQQVKNGVAWKAITKEFNSKFSQGLSPDALRKRYQRDTSKLETLGDDSVEKAFKLIKQNPVKPTELARKFNLDIDGLEDLMDDLLNSRAAIKLHQGYLIFDKGAPQPDNYEHDIELFTVGEWVKWGVISDQHICSIHEQMDLLHKFYKICEEEKVKGIIAAGDFTAGNGTVYKGQLHDLKIIGEDKQINYTCHTYPETNLLTYTISGNHDLDLYKQCGSDIVQKIADKREDIVYLGKMNAILKQDGIRFMVRHGEGGLGAIRSYKPQRILDVMQPDDICDISIVGHYHVQLDMPYRNSIVILPACFEGQSEYLSRKGLIPDIGGCILNMKIADINGKKKIVRHYVDYLDLGVIKGL
jgi:predicted phosphodiesterase